MPQVTIEINARSYAVNCGDGEEERLVALVRYVDAKVRELAAQLGPVGETRLLMLACLTLADELGDAYNAAEEGRSASLVQSTEARGVAAKAAQEGKALKDRVGELETRLTRREDALVRHLDQIAKRLTGIAGRLETD